MRPKLVVLGASAEAWSVPEPVSSPERRLSFARHPCEFCRCCACHKACTKCRDNCCPGEGYLVPVVYCPDFADVRTLVPVRYLYRSDYGCEYRLHLPGTR